MDELFINDDFFIDVSKIDNFSAQLSSIDELPKPIEFDYISSNRIDWEWLKSSKVVIKHYDNLNDYIIKNRYATDK